MEEILDGYIYKINEDTIDCLILVGCTEQQYFIRKRYSISFFIDNGVIPINGNGFEEYYDNGLKVRSEASNQYKLRIEASRYAGT